MENPAHDCTTGIPMSAKGKVNQKNYGSEGGESCNSASHFKGGAYDSNKYSCVSINDISNENVEYVNNFIQDGVQEILYDIVCTTDLPIEVDASEHTGEIIPSLSDKNNHNGFIEPSNVCTRDKLCPLSTANEMDDEELDEPLENINFSVGDLHKIVKIAESDPVSDMEEQQKKLNESISAIAKSLGLEDLLPETFHVGTSKDILSITVANDNESNDIEHGSVRLSLTEYSKDTPTESDHIRFSELNATATSKPKYLKDIETSFHALKEGNENVEFFVRPISKELIKKTQIESDMTINDTENTILDATDSFNFLEKIDEQKKISLNGSSDMLTENGEISNGLEFVNIDDTNINDVPNIGDVPVLHLASATEENDTNTGATVSITTDKISKKMHILLTTSEGQQVFEINTDSLNSIPSSLDLQLALEKDLQSSLPCVAEQLIMEPELITNDMDSFESNNDEDEVQGNDDSHIDQFVKKISSNRRQKRMWPCPVEGCDVIVNKECKLRVHMITHEDARPFKCTVDGCDWAFTTPYRLRRHLETHIGKKDYICDFEGCHRRFTTVYNLNTHKKRHKWPNSLTCPAEGCNMNFANRRKLELHLRVHEDIEAPYKCSMCDKKYYSANCIASHYRAHQYNEDDFKCPFKSCGKKYDKICRLRQHIRHHTGDRPYACPAEGCTWSFMSASKLTRHMRKHTGERKFVCSEPGCGKSFLRPEHLKGHMVIHSGTKPFQCPHENCKARFTAKSSLYVHVKKHCASGLKIVYPCPSALCLKQYNNKATLEQHVQKFHHHLLVGNKQLDISQKVEFSMPVSVVTAVLPNNNVVNNICNVDQNGVNALEDVESKVKSENFVEKELMVSSISDLENTDQSLAVQSILDESSLKDSGPLKLVHYVSELTESPKDCGAQNESPTRLLQENNSGSARTDYCCNHILSMRAKKWWLLQNRTRLGPLNSMDDSRVPETNVHFSAEPGSSGIDIRSPDVMLASSSIAFQDQTTEHLEQGHFLPDEPPAGMYQDDSILVSNSSFGSELTIPVSLLSDSEESVIAPDSSTSDFSASNTVDAFGDSTMNLQGLE